MILAKKIVIQKASNFFELLLSGDGMSRDLGTPQTDAPTNLSYNHAILAAVGKYTT
jgi:hypothetical protein